jgi:4-amino-4-deoxy-L-arabinose transferase-like glycosyltransferase
VSINRLPRLPRILALGTFGPRGNGGRVGVPHQKDGAGRIEGYPGGGDRTMAHWSRIGSLSPSASATAIVCLGLLLLPLFVRPAASSVWDANEAFYVQTPREMVESGDWLRPTFNGQPRLNKPPLSYWVVAVPYRLFGVDLVWARLVMALAGTGSVLLLYVLGRQLLDPAAALVGAALFATTFRFLIVSRRLLIDALLLFLILAAVVAFVHWARTGRRAPFLLMCLALGLGFLTKGPAAWLPLPLFALYLVWAGGWNRLRSAPWIAGGLILVAVSGSWFVLLGFTHGWEVVSAFLLEENVGRYLAVDFGPRRGPFYYFGVLLGDFFPWSILLPAALWIAVRRSAERSAAFFLTGWIVLYLGVFSLSYNKQEYYILPLYAAAALLIAGYGSAAAGRDFARLSARAAGVLLVAAGAVFVPVGLSLFPSSRWVVLLALFLAAAGVFLWRARILPAALLLSGFYAAAFFFLAPALEQYRPVFPLVESLRRLSDAADIRDFRVGYYRFTAPSLRFYLDRDILESYDPDEAAAFLRSGDPAFLLTDEPGLAELRTRVPEMEVLDRRPRLRTTLRSLIRPGPNTEQHPEHRWTSSVYLVGTSVPGPDRR